MLPKPVSVTPAASGLAELLCDRVTRPPNAAVSSRYLRFRITHSINHWREHLITDVPNGGKIP